jgi:hypothetical protein
MIVAFAILVSPDVSPRRLVRRLSRGTRSCLKAQAVVPEGVLELKSD